MTLHSEFVTRVTRFVNTWARYTAATDNHSVDHSARNWIDVCFKMLYAESFLSSKSNLVGGAECLHILPFLTRLLLSGRHPITCPSNNIPSSARPAEQTTFKDEIIAIKPALKLQSLVCRKLPRLCALLDTDYNIRHYTIYGLFLNCYRVLWILGKIYLSVMFGLIDIIIKTFDLD